LRPVVRCSGIGLLSTTPRRALLSVIAALLAGLALCGSARAANVTVGPSLGGAWESSPCAKTWCTFVNTELANGRPITSPVDGAVVGFSVVGGSTAGSYRLRTANQLGGDFVFEFGRLSPLVAAVPNAGIQSYSTLLPVKSGQSIGLVVGKGASMAFQEKGHYVEWVRELTEGGEEPGQADWPENTGYNVEIQPAPTITGLSVTSGPIGGGTALTITGSDLEEASAVSFGGTPATNIVSNSGSRIEVVAPASGKAATVPVTVTTVAGKGSGASFTYGDGTSTPGGKTAKGKTAAARCVVPNLKGKKLKAAKTVLGKAHCKLGTVTTAGGATTKTGKVAKQGSKPGTKLAAGARVKVTLKP
jgi:hypothetical protein